MIDPSVVEDDVGVRQVVHDHDVVFFCQRNDLLEKRQVDALRGSIALRGTFRRGRKGMC
jgi:hypothetical protein